MNKKHIVTIAMIGGALYLVYVYLRNNGTWARWFAPANTNEFSDEAALLAYCNQQNLAIEDGGLAVFVDQQGTKHSATCADWIRSQGSPKGMAAIEATHPGVDKTMLEKLRAAASSSPILGCDRANVDQWNLLLQELDPTAQTSDLSAAGVTRGQNDVMNALTYLTLRCQCGLSQVAPPDVAFHNPAEWVN